MYLAHTTNALQSYKASPAKSDHTMLPAIWHR